MADERTNALSIGAMVGGYRITRHIGGGGMGTVYAAEEPIIHKRVAIKVLRDALADDASSAARFEREARAANDVRHPAIVDVFAFGKMDDGRPYLVMSLLEGRSLRQEIEDRGRIPPAEAWSWAREIGEALAAAHEADIVHRDLKPDNVFLERFAGKATRPRLLDLGIAKLMRREDGASAQPMKLTQSGVPLGTPAYMAPEQWWGIDVDARADQYSFGVTLFEMLSGHPPFRSQQFMELAQHHMNTKAPTLDSVGCTVPQAVEDLVARALEKSASDRFSSMTELIEAGNAAFAALPAVDLATAETVRQEITPELALQLRRPSAALPAASTPSENDGCRKRLRRYDLVHVVIVIGGPSALIALGYPGELRHDVRNWLRTGGPPMLPIVLSFVAGAIALYVSSRKRARVGTPSFVLWIFALVTAVCGAVGTYVGYRRVELAAHMTAPVRFEIFHMGMYEVDLSRFLGFSFASFLFASIAAAAGLFGEPGHSGQSGTLTEAVGTRRRESIAACVVLLAFAAAAIAVHAPSAALTPCLAAFVVAFDLLLPPLAARTAARDELERAAAGVVAVALVLAVSASRIEARESALWLEQPTRAARAAEIVAAAAERAATLSLGLASLSLVLLVEILRLRRVWRRTKVQRPSGATLAMAAVVLALGVADVLQYVRFASARDRMHAELEPQFALFAQLDPPTSGALDSARHSPHPAPALQIARNFVAVNAVPSAPLSAASSPEGLLNIARDLSHALAEHVARGVDHGADLSVFIDREVPWTTVVQLLAVAQRSGAHHVELLLTRGPPLSLPEGTPPEASWVLARDFIALRVELADEGFRAAADQPFGDVAPELVRRAMADERAVAIATTR